jgi:hypothetical protein
MRGLKMSLLPDLVLFAHVLLIVVWLGFDLVVFSLSLRLLNRKLPAVVWPDRAHVAEVIDRYVLCAFLLTTPIGVWLARLNGWSLMANPWLATKLILYGFILLMALRILTSTAGTKPILQNLVDGAGNAEEHELRLRKKVIGLAPYALALPVSIAAIIVIALWCGVRDEEQATWMPWAFWIEALAFAGYVLWALLTQTPGKPLCWVQIANRLVHGLVLLYGLIEFSKFVRRQIVAHSAK